MTADTYLARYTGTGVSGEVILGVHNTTGSKVVKIYRAFCSPAGIAVAAIAKWIVKRISALAGGDDLYPAQFAKMDTNDADLPAQVLFKTNGSGTFVSEISPRRPGIQTLNSVALARLFSCVGGPSWPDINCGAMIPPVSLDSGLQHWTLREGEGIAIDMVDTDFITNPRDFYMIVRNPATGAVYNVYVRDEGPDDPSKNALAVFNGVGSGVVIEIVEMGTYLNGSNLSGRQYFGKLNKRLDIGNARVITPVKMDSTSPNLPAGINAYNHVLFDPLEEKFGFSLQPYIASSVMYDVKQRYSSMNALLTFCPSSIGKGPGRAVGGLGGLTNTHQVCAMFDATRNGKPVEVLENELVGFYAPMFFGDATGQRYEYTIEFTVEDVPAPPAGATAAPRPYFGLGFG